ncbi:MAG: putative L-amino-acid oxidase YobN [Cyclobacteriaceae bacterium]|nr:MAG: putative L-amino-acid oxidase YobN [Cyclobacteriaceae bacterium]
MDQRRRDFIRTTALAGTGTSLLGSTAIHNMAGSSIPSTRSASKSVIIAGGGIGGLCCAYELMQLGHDVIVLEASGRHGGHVFTGRDGLADDLYVDYGAEHFTKPGYDKCWEYIEQFNLTALPYPRRVNVARRIDGKFYTEEMLADPSVLKKFGFNQREVKYLSENPWWDLGSLYYQPYLDKFTNEYQPFNVGYDDWDTIPMADILEKDGASSAALNFLGGKNTSALFTLWQAGILNLRGVPLSPPDVYRIKGGNQGLTNAFAKRLGTRLKLNCPISGIRHGQSGVTVSYREFGEEKEMSADYLANCIPLPVFRRIAVEPALTEDKQFVIDNLTYGTYARVVFQAASEFWLDDNLSINMQLDHPDIWSMWRVAEEVDTERVALMGTGPAGISPQRALAGFKEVYPGKSLTIEQALVKDWPNDSFAPTCERLAFPMGTLTKFWPQLMQPQGRIHFAGSYADNLGWGMEAATRSANRVAKEIDQA